MKKLLLLIALMYSCQLTFSQQKYRIISIPVESNGKKLHLPWSGGLDSPQFSPFDINQDGKTDLFVYDRAGNKPLIFLSTGLEGDAAFAYAPQYESLFPDTATDWMLLRDYNYDSIPDIFTHDPLGSRVYKGSIQNGQLHFDLVCPLVKYDDGPFRVNIWTNIADIPVFTDVNRDGDMDVLSYSLFGTSVEYYENQAVERAGNPAYSVDSFRFKRQTGCWGKFTQSSFTNSLNLHDNICEGLLPSPGGSDNSRHTGNSLFAFDADNDHDVDLLNGNVGYSNLAFLHNCGDSTVADVCEWDSLFSSCNVHVNIHSYPAAFGFDVDGDEYEDVLVAPNVYAGQGNNIKNVWHYRNTKDPSCPFEFVSDSFLVNGMIDLGSNSKPVFFDINGDGLQDIIAGNGGYYNPTSTPTSALAYFENVGTSTDPKFSLITLDYDSLSKYPFTGMYPAFGDLDGDEKPDMLLGETNGYVHFFRNSAVTGVNFPSLTEPSYFLMKVNQNSAPFIYDVNDDGLNDVLIGGSNGKISYYWNYGTKFEPQFSADSVNDFLGEVSVTPYGYALGYSAPVVLNDEESGQMKLLVGSAGGRIYAYELDPAKLRAGRFTLIDSNYMRQRLGLRANISVADINDDGLMEYVAGNSLGGIFMLSDSLWDSTARPIVSVLPLSKEEELHLYPNPAKDNITCSLVNGRFISPQAEVYNILGERMKVEVVTAADQVTIRLNDLSDGFYFVRLTDGDKSYTGKMLIQK